MVFIYSDLPLMQFHGPKNMIYQSSFPLRSGILLKRLIVGFGRVRLSKNKHENCTHFVKLQKKISRQLRYELYKHLKVHTLLLLLTTPSDYIYINKCRIIIFRRRNSEIVIHTSCMSSFKREMYSRNITIA